MAEKPRPMPLAELNECCGQYQCGTEREPYGVAGFAQSVCDNCPLVIDDQQRRVLRAARAM